MSVLASKAAVSAGLDVGNIDITGVKIRIMPSWMSRLIGTGVAAMTLGDTILVTESRYDQVANGGDAALLVHELIHVGQWRREGRASFLVQYLSDYVRNRMIGLDHEMAYRAIGFEAAAYEVSEHPDRILA